MTVYTTGTEVRYMPNTERGLLEEPITEEMIDAAIACSHDKLTREDAKDLCGAILAVRAVPGIPQREKLWDGLCECTDPNYDLAKTFDKVTVTQFIFKQMHEYSVWRIDQLRK